MRTSTIGWILRSTCVNMNLMKTFSFSSIQIPASVISSVGTINYQQSQVFVVSNPINISDSTPISFATNASTVHAQDTFSVPSSVADGNVNSKMIQHTTNVQPPRLHPKKRKFDLSELEEEHQTPSQNVCNNQVTISAPPATSTNVTLAYQTNQGHNGNGSYQAVTSGNYTPYNPTIVTQVVRNTGEVIKKQFTNYR